MQENLRNIVYPAVRRLILLGEIRPGDAINVAELARRFGISHIPVREAISQLQKDGLVEVRLGQGAYAMRQDMRQSIELAQIRQTLEVAAAGTAARRADAAMIRQLQETMDQMIAIARKVAKRRMMQFDDPTLIEFVGADLTFHRQIVRMTGNRELLALLGNINHVIRVYMMNNTGPSEVFVETTRLTVHQHQQVFDAIAAGDPRAARRAMAAHLRYSTRKKIQRLADPLCGEQWFFPGQLLDFAERLEAEDRLLFDQPGHARAAPARAAAAAGDPP